MLLNNPLKYFNPSAEPKIAGADANIRDIEKISDRKSRSRQKSFGGSASQGFRGRDIGDKTRRTKIMVRIIYGCVTRGGRKHSGEGFTVKRSPPGIYDITFDVPFTSPPAVVATQQYALRKPDTWDDFENKGGSTKDNVVVIALDETRARLKTGDGDGIEANRNFSFIAIGVQIVKKRNKPIKDARSNTKKSRNKR